jgi:hypothetical protein
MKRPRKLSLNTRLVAIETLLIAAWLKSVLSDAIVGSGMQNWIKVLVVMGMTIGLLGGLLLWLESLTRESVKSSHKLMRGFASAFWIHAALLLCLFLLYAHMLHLKVP